MIPVIFEHSPLLLRDNHGFERLIIVDPEQTIKLFKYEIPMKEFQLLPYESVFEITREGKLKFQCLGAQIKRLYEKIGVDLCDEEEMEEEEVKKKDNRDYADDDSAQQLSEEQIESFRAEGKTELQIVKELIKGSRTFNQRTKFSKSKYILNKLSKYLYLIELHKPTLPLLVDHFAKYKAQQICHLRSDSFGLLLHYSGSWPGQRIGVIDGTNGLVTAGLQQRMNRNGQIHHFQLMRTAKLEYMSYTADAREIIRIWNLPEIKKDIFASTLLAQVELDGVVAVHDKFSPLDCLRLMWDNLKNGGVLTLFSIFLEPLMEVKRTLESKKAGIMIHVEELFTRKYQVEPHRTHPLMRMHPSSGFVLRGNKVKSKEKL